MLFVGPFVGLSVLVKALGMLNKLLKELQAKFKTAERASKLPEEEGENIEPDFMWTNDNSNETIGMPLIL